MNSIKKYFSAFAAFLLFAVCQQAAAQRMINHGPWLQHLGKDGVTIVWTTNTDCISWVEAYEYDGSNFYQQERPKYFSSSDGLKTIGRIHKVTLQDLKPGTKYAYRIFSREVVSKTYSNPIFGRTDASEVYQRQPLFFTTEDAAKEKNSIVVLTDIHNRSAVIGSLLKDVNLAETDFVMTDGDFVSTFNKEEDLFDGGIDTLVDLFATTKPFYVTRGNHETRGTMGPAFKNYFYFPDNKYYYTFTSGKTLFIVLDCGEDKPDSDKEYSDLVDFDAYRNQEVRWLKQVVVSDQFKSAEHVVVFLHMPPFFPGRTPWHGDMEMRQKFFPVLNDAGIDLMISGHTHRYAFIDKNTEGNKFPVIVLSNNCRMDLTIDKNGIKAKTTDITKKVLSDLTFTK
ncbi:MAG TPA: FN3 domain-containing metallophosphoesterase family protein [Bacteroidales bacterium]|nr:FN3 domain-containing metallophosphoesterase family protein [Bacteroidales bacterium]